MKPQEVPGMRQSVEPPQEEQLQSLPMPIDQAERNALKEIRVNGIDSTIPPTMGKKDMRVIAPKAREAGNQSKRVDQESPKRRQNNFKPPAMRKTMNWINEERKSKI